MAMGYDAEVSHKTNAIPRIVGLQPTASGIISVQGRSMEVITDDVVDRLQKVFGVNTDVALASALGLSKNAPGNWRKRNAAPYELCAQIAAANGVSSNWLLFGVGDQDLEACRTATGQSVHKLTPPADRITQFVGYWDASRAADEVVWLEQQLKRAVPEYGEWLASPAVYQSGN